MSDFRTKILGLAAIATTFAGVSYGQVVCNVGGAAGNLVQPTANVGFLLRAEGETEQVSSTTFSCGNVAGGQAASALTHGATVLVTLSLPVSSKAIAQPFNGAGNSEATLVIQDMTAVAGVLPAPVAYSGTVTGNLISFANVTFPANFTASIFDVRVNASGSGGLTTVVPVTESIIVGQNGIAEYAPMAVTVGQVLRGLAAPTLVGNPGQQTFLSNGNASATIPLCNGDVISNIVAPTAAFNITVNEGFPGAFKLQADPLGNVTNQEQGQLLNPANGVGVANSATQITLTFTNVPATATLYVPTVVSIIGPLGFPATLTLASSQVAATSPAGLTKIAPVNNNGPVAALPAAVAGSVTAVYTVTATNALQQENFNIPVYVNVPASTAAAPLAPQGPFTVLESFAPAGALPAGGLANSVPLFAPTSNTAINIQSVVVCNTTILFPFVTNASGFETGIALTNTTTDNLGPVIPPATTGLSFAAAANGTCVLNFYGNATQPAAFTTPVMGISTTTVATGGPVYANTLSAMSGATNFTGYAIAQCNFLEAHGFAYIVDNFGTPSGTAEGYLGIVIPNFRGETNVGTGE